MHELLRPEAGLAGREANRGHALPRRKEGAGGGTMGSPAIKGGGRRGNHGFTRQNDHGLHTREPAIGRQIQDVPLA